VASFSTPPATVDHAIGYADELMYQAKHAGKAGVRAQTY
jgi:PleD family two-component response regulator